MGIHPIKQDEEFPGKTSLTFYSLASATNKLYWPVTLWSQFQLNSHRRIQKKRNSPGPRSIACCGSLFFRMFIDPLHKWRSDRNGGKVRDGDACAVRTGYFIIIKTYTKSSFVISIVFLKIIYVVCYGSNYIMRKPLGVLLIVFSVQHRMLNNYQRSAILYPANHKPLVPVALYQIPSCGMRLFFIKYMSDSFGGVASPAEGKNVSWRGQ